jgi:hypothetical protein
MILPSLSPMILKLGIAAVAVALVATSSYVLGRKHVRAAWDAERAANALVAAKAEAANRLTEKSWLELANKAEVRHAQTLRDTTARASDERQRLRDAAATSRIVSTATGTTGRSAEVPRCATRSELLGLGEELIRLAGAADTERAGLMACAQAWPR